jgi:hypothetical protein
MRALGSAFGLLLSESTEVRDVAEKLERHLHDLCTSEAQL